VQPSPPPSTSPPTTPSRAETGPRHSRSADGWRLRAAALHARRAKAGQGAH
jgi:hypothetical protein